MALWPGDRASGTPPGPAARVRRSARPAARVRHSTGPGGPGDRALDPARRPGLAARPDTVD